jgi:hypothetical protein
MARSVRDHIRARRWTMFSPGDSREKTTAQVEKNPVTATPSATRIAERKMLEVMVCKDPV